MNEERQGRNDVEVFFLPPATNRAPNRREVELAQAAAKGHVARLIHRRRDVHFARPAQSSPQASDLRDQSQQKSNYSLVNGTKLAEIPISGEPGSFEGHATTEGDRRTTNKHFWEQIAGQASNSTVLALSRPSSSSPTPTPFLYNPSAWPIVGPELSNPRNVKLLHHALNLLWPGHDLPGTWRIHKPPFTMRWHDFIAEGPGLFHATMYKCALYYQVHEIDSEISPRDTAFHYQQALQSIRAGVSVPIERITEETIWMVLIVSLSGNATEVMLSEAGPSFDPQFPNLQWVQTYTKVEPQHQEALFRMVELRGGLDALNMNGLKASITNLDIITSTRTLSRPRLTRASLFEKFMRLYHRANYFGLANDLLLERYGSDLQDAQSSISAWLTKTHKVPDNLVDVLDDMRVWSEVISTYADETLFAELDLSRLAINRNLLQHRLLSTIALDESIDTEFEPIIRASGAITGEYQQSSATGATPDIARLLQTALLIFSIGVIFPVQNAQLHQVLASRLSAIMQAYLSWFTDSAQVHSQAHALAVWALLLGCMSARQGGDTACVEMLQDLLHRVVGAEVSPPESTPGESPRQAFSMSWSELKEEILKPWVWHEGACDRIGKSVWSTILERHRVRDTDVREKPSESAPDL